METIFDPAEYTAYLRWNQEEYRTNPHLRRASLQQVRAHVETEGHRFINPQPHYKCNARAAALRREGNRMYAEKQFETALEKYNESICAALTDSEDLSMGYANRSAVMYEMQIYARALANITLAKKHQYPERLTPKLLLREANCKQKLNERSSIGNLKSFALSLEPNDRIPFLVKGIRAQFRPNDGQIMVAERYFTPGQVILNEKPLIGGVSYRNVFLNCHHCFSTNSAVLIPCPNCASAMFCDEECMQKGDKLHRFECGHVSELAMCAVWSGPRLFFYGLSLFENDIEKMMAFCRDNRQAIGGSFCDLDYTNYDPLEEFGAILKARQRFGDPRAFHVVKMAAAVSFTIYMQVPLVRALIKNETQENFMLQCFVDFMIIANGLSIEPCSLIFPIASGFKHSCDPNTILLDVGDRVTLVVLRPIRRGDRIHISVGPMYYQSPEKHIRLMSKEVVFVCRCDFCDKNKRPAWWAKAHQPSSINPEVLAEVNMAMEVSASKPHIERARMALDFQQFIERYAPCHPQKAYARVVKEYGDGLQCCYNFDARHGCLKTD